MSTIREVIIEEYRKYPYMEMDDFIKLIYQHVCGGNHLLSDIAKAKEYLDEEYINLEASKRVPLYEDIGNNIIRINLARYKYEGLDIDALFNTFKMSSEIYHMDIMEMEHAFDALKGLARQHRLPFKINELEEYLAKYRKANYPLVSHSEAYKKHYDPHYRIIHKLYLNELINQ